jgi:hypothetical protein
LKEILTTQGLWALLQHRIEASVYRGTLPAVIGANSLVRSDVPAHNTVLGVPAVVISDRGSEDYL